MNDAAALALVAAAIDSFQSLNPSLLEVFFKIPSGVGKLREDDHLAVLQVFVGLEHFHQCLELVVFGGIDLGAEVEEIDDLIEVHEGVVENFFHLVEARVEFFDAIQIFFGEKIPILVIVIPTGGPELLLVRRCVADELGVFELPAFQ